MLVNPMNIIPAGLPVSKNFTVTLENKNTDTIHLSSLFHDHMINDNLSASISIADNASITVIDDLVDASLTHTSKNKLEFFIGAGAKLTYSMKTIKLLGESAVVEKELLFKLMGKHSEVTATSSCFLTGNQVFKFLTLQEHHAQHATSSVTVKAVVDNQAKIVCNGMIRVEKAAQRTMALLLNKNILLSRLARAVSIPQLEIEADDVICKHGAASLMMNNSFTLRVAALTMSWHKTYLLTLF